MRNTYETLEEILPVGSRTIVPLANSALIGLAHAMGSDISLLYMAPGVLYHACVDAQELGESSQKNKLEDMLGGLTLGALWGIGKSSVGYLGAKGIGELINYLF